MLNLIKTKILWLFILCPFFGCNWWVQGDGWLICGSGPVARFNQNMSLRRGSASIDRWVLRDENIDHVLWPRLHRYSILVHVPVSVSYLILVPISYPISNIHCISHVFLKKWYILYLYPYPWNLGFISSPSRLVSWYKLQTHNSSQLD